MSEKKKEKKKKYIPVDVDVHAALVKEVVDADG